jgi:hypothetical protein
VADTQSATHLFTCGVPQGSSIGPLLFTAYVAPIANIIHAHGLYYHQYADDLLIYAPIHPSDLATSIDKISACLAEVRDWFLLNHMLLNASKTELLLVGTQLLIARYRPMVKILFAGSTLIPANFLKYLDITFDPTLTFTKHATNIASSVRSVASAIHHLRPTLNTSIASGLAVSLGLSKLDYSLSVFAGTSARNLSTLQRAQNSLVRSIFSLPWHFHVSDFYQSLHWLIVSQRITFRIGNYDVQIIT